MLFIYNSVGFILLAWYCSLRWYFCSKEIWINNPINFTTAISSILFLIPTLMSRMQSYGLFFFWLAFFIWFRNCWYTIEDIIDYKNYPSIKQAVYVIIDILMVFYSLLWIIFYKIAI